MMKPLSAADAISPAFSRTRALLMPPDPAPGIRAPFRFGFFLKIATVAALTQPNVYGFLFGMFFECVAILAGVGGSLGHHALNPGHLYPALAMMIAVAGFFMLAFGVFCTWLWCRLRFTVFDLAVHLHGQVARAWRPYGAQAWRFFGLMLLIGLGLLMLLAVTAGPLMLHFILAISHLSPEQINNNPQLILSHVVPMYGVIFLFFFLACIVDAVTQDFILPPLAVDDARLGSAFSRFFEFVRGYPGRFALYLLLRFVLELGLMWVGMMSLFLVMGIALLGGGGLGFLLYQLFWHAGPAGVTIFVLYCILTGLLVIALYLLLTIALYGTVALVKQCYAVGFYGSYYPALGDQLAPPPAPSGALPPASPPPPPFTAVPESPGQA